MTISDTLRRRLRTTEIDSAVVYAAVCRFWTLLSGPISILLVIRCLSREEQGYYYTAFSLLSARQLLDLGLCTVATQLASHEWVKLRLEADGSLGGDLSARNRIGWLFQLITRWFAVGAAILTVILAAGGDWFFDGGLPGESWRGAWWLLCLFAGINLLTIPARALLEGCCQVAPMQRMNLGEQFYSKLALFAALLLGGGIWSPTLSAAVATAWNVLFLWRRYGSFFRSLPRRATAAFDWKNEVLPLQWRLGVSWAANYLLVWLFTPIVFRFCGAAAAGQFGLTQNLVKLAGSLAMVIMGVKLPVYGTLAAEQRWQELDRRFRNGTLTSIALLLPGMAALIGGVALVEYLLPAYANRFLPVYPTAVLALAEVFLALTVPFTVYLRAFKREPLYWIMAVSAVLMVPGAIAGAFRSGALGVAWAAAAVNALCCFGTFTVWAVCRKRWQQKEAKAERSAQWD